jgi:3-oxoacyl-[acyl-carrier protein] reductase
MKGTELKLHGTRRLTLHAWEALKASKGSVVFISGSAAFDPKPASAAVATINAAIIALAKAFSEQGIKDGVQVNSVVPGAVMLADVDLSLSTGLSSTSDLSRKR